jgi:secreted PhoX family phosphatase
MTMDRRTFLHRSAAVGLVVVGGKLLAACGDDEQRAATSRTTTSGQGARPETSTTTSTVRPGVTRYGPLGTVPDANDLLLPAGFTSEPVAVGGEIVAGTSYVWHPLPDGGGCIPTDDGGWFYANNSEVQIVGAGGASALRFDADGRVVDAYRLLTDTTWNCAGGVTPWGTWLSCEEIETGLVWECDVRGQGRPMARPAMGAGRHEAVVADEARQVLYVSEDEVDGLVYRFTPARWGDLSEGRLDALAVADDGGTTWVAVAGLGDAGTPTRYDAPGATHFGGPEGMAMHGDVLFVSTKYDDTLHRLDLARSRMTVLWAGDPITGPDNLAVHPGTGNLFVCEDAGDMEVVVVTPDRQAEAFLRFVGHDTSEVTGAAFDPSGTRLIVNSQRAPTPKTMADVVRYGGSETLGRTYMITGPF